jgi:hypothetical protein
MLFLLAIIACISLAHGAGLDVNTCAGGLPATSYVEISDCTTTPCYLIRGTYVSGRIEFETRKKYNFTEIEIDSSTYFSQLFHSIRHCKFTAKSPIHRWQWIG